MTTNVAKAFHESVPAFKATQERANIFKMQNIALLLDREGRILEASSGFLNLIKQELAECQGVSILSYRDVFSMADWQRIVETCAKGNVAKQELWINSGDMMCDPYHIVATPVEEIDGSPSTFFMLAVKETIIEDEKRALVNSAYRDHLTGLFNRRFLEDHFDDFLSNCDAGKTSLAVLVIDVNDFKSINDTHGHSVGDQVLRAIAHAIERATPLGETVVRYGGDEFVVVLHDVADLEQAEDVAGEIKFEVSKPITFVDEFRKIGVSIGVSLYPTNAKTFSGLIDAADAHMYREKHSVKNDPKMECPVVDGVPNWRNLVTTHFSTSLIIPYFQPMTELSSNRICGAEVLCRMRKPDGTLADPCDFIPVAENLGSIDKIDLAIFDAACAEMARKRDHLPNHFFMSVNLSAQTLAVPDLPILLASALRRNNAEAKNFCIELTESTILLESGCGRDNLWTLHEMGFEVALDDFGTGFSSMSLIKDIPVSKVKIDRSFVAGINRSHKDHALVQSIIFMSRKLGLDCVCEGVEQPQQAATLRALGANYGQGYFWGRPAPIETLCEKLGRTSVSTA